MTWKQWVAIAVPAVVAAVGALAPVLKEHPAASVVVLALIAAVNALKVQALGEKEAE